MPKPAKWCLRLVLFLSIATVAAAQTPAPGGEQKPVTDAPPAQSDSKPADAKPPEAAPAAPPTWSIGPIDFSGLVDGYYAFNSNHPVSQNNQLYNFDVKANQFSLNMAKLSLSHTADPIGFQVDFGFGRAFDIISAGEQAPSIFRNIEQAYLSVKPAKAKGLEIDFGKFVTSAGAEVIETNSNWNYSRSLLFAWAIPYYHFGLRATMPFGKYFTAGVQLVNGWNNVEDNNSGKTIGLTGTFNTRLFSWSNNYYGGPENANTSKGWRHLYDTTLLLTPTSRLNAYLNFDYARNTLFAPLDTPPILAAAPVATIAVRNSWYGIAGAVHYQATSKFAFVPRLEWFRDREGFSTGTAQTLKEVTLTGEYKMLEGLLARLEYRRDWSNVPFFDRGASLGIGKNQNTLALGMVAFFGPKR